MNHPAPRGGVSCGTLVDGYRPKGRGKAPTTNFTQYKANVFAQEFDDPYSFTSFDSRREPIRAVHIRFDVDEDLRPKWRDADSTGIALSTQQLADRYLSRVIERAYASPRTPDTEEDLDD
jgi:hypothetical protein